jgi:hypothetical protein
MLRRWNGRPRVPPGYDADIWETARMNAREGFSGATIAEPHVHNALRTLAGDLARAFRRDDRLHAARGVVTRCEHAVLHAREQRDSPPPDDLGSSASGQVGDVVRLEAAARARTRRRANEQALIGAQRQLADAQAQLRDAEAGVLDSLVEIATGGVDRLNTYVAAYNLVRQYEGRPGLEPLDEGIAETLVRNAVQPLLVDG